MLSMHSRLAQIYRNRASRLNLSILFFSGLAATFTFADDRILSWCSVRPEVAHFSIGIASAIVFACGLVELKVDWAERGKLHAEAARQLGTLKQRFRQVRAAPDQVTESDLAALQAAYEKLAEVLVPIPDDAFTRLKAYHLYKVEVSKFLDDHPGLPAILAKVAIRLQAILGRTKRKIVSPDAQN